MKWTLEEQKAMKASRDIWVRTDRVDGFIRRLIDELKRKTELPAITQRLSLFFDAGRGRPSGGELREYIENLLREGSGLSVGLDIAWDEYNGVEPSKPKVVPIRSTPKPEPPPRPKPPTDTTVEELYALIERERDDARAKLQAAEHELQVVGDVLRSMEDKRDVLSAELASAREELREKSAELREQRAQKVDLSKELRKERQRVIQKLIDAGMPAAAVMAALT